MEAVAMRKLETDNERRTFVLVFPTEKKKGRLFLREFVCLMLIREGYRAIGIHDWTFGNFPERITVQHDGMEDREEMASLKDFLQKLDIKVERSEEPWNE